MHWAFRQRGLSDGCARLLHVLSDYADENGVCWPSRGRLAERIEKSVDTVDRRANELIEAGMMCRAPRNRVSANGNVTTLSNAYYLHIKGQRACAQCEADTSRTSAAGDVERPRRNSAARRTLPEQEDAPREGGRKSAAAGDDETDRTIAAGGEVAAEGAARAAARGAAPVAAAESFIEPPDSSSFPRPRGSAGGLKGAAGELVALVNHPKLDPTKAPGLVTTTAWVAAFQRLELSIEEIALVICHVLEVRDRRNPQADDITTWNFFTKAMREFAAEKAAASLTDAPETLNAATADNFRPLNAAERESALTRNRRASWSAVLSAAEHDVVPGSGQGGDRDEPGAGGGADLFANDPRRTAAGGS